MVHINIALLMSEFQRAGRNTVSRMNSLVFFVFLLAPILLVMPLSHNNITYRWLSLVSNCNFSIGNCIPKWVGT